jgi:hypothetical protein
MSDPSLGGGPGLPGYQPTGYGAYQAQPPMPDRVKFAVNLMLAGAVLKAVDGIFLVSSASSAFRGDSMIGAFVAVGLWIWMSVAIRGGANWARITGTVFFGIATLGVLVDLAILVDPRVHVHDVATVAVGFDLVNWAIGLCVVIVIWQRTNAYFFRPQLEGPRPY